MKEDFYWIHRDYGSPSLNNIAQRLVEYHTALLFSNYNVHYTDKNKNYKNFAEVGTIFLDYAYNVTDVHVINSLMNYNVYFKNATENVEPVDESNLDFVVTLASKDLLLPYTNKVKQYIVDISPLALEKTKSFLETPQSQYHQLDIFNIDAVNEFLKTIEGNCGYFDLSNCFLYMPSSILYDVELRVKKQNEFLNCLRNDSRIWYISMKSANGNYYYNKNVKDICNEDVDSRFRTLPWLN